MGFRRFLVVLLLAVSALAVVPAAQAADPPSGPYGIVDPTGACPGLEQWVEKCLPNAVGYAQGFGVRIVTDQLIATDQAPGADGQITFWCETPKSLRYQVRVSGLAPNTTYAVTASGIYISDIFDPNPQPTLVDLGTIGYTHTDASGSGVTGGNIQLQYGAYDLDVHVGTVLTSDPADLQGFVVFK